MFTTNTKIAISEKVQNMFDRKISPGKGMNYFRNVATRIVTMHKEEDYDLYLNDPYHRKGEPLLSIKEFSPFYKNSIADTLQRQLRAEWYD